MEKSLAIYTIGHSNISVEELISLLHQYKIACVVDVRRFPSSKKFPQFNKNFLSKSLMESHIAYHWMGDQLGGYRKGGYEAYTKTEEFQLALKKLMELARMQQTTIMCAEKLYFRCHRKFIAEMLIENDWQVIHIFDEKRAYPHNTMKLL